MLNDLRAQSFRRALQRVGALRDGCPECHGSLLAQRASWVLLGVCRRLAADLGFPGTRPPVSGSGEWGWQGVLALLSHPPLSAGALHSMLGAMDKRVSEEVTILWLLPQ